MGGKCNVLRARRAGIVKGERAKHEKQIKTGNHQRIEGLAPGKRVVVLRVANVPNGGN